MTMKNSGGGEIPYIHYLRAFACILVVAQHCVHVPMFTAGDEFFQSWIIVLTRPCNCLFFMISGVLLLPYNLQSHIVFYKKRLRRLVFPLFIWGILYSILPCFLIGNSYKSAIYDILWLPLTYPEQVGGILWFLYIYIGIIIFIPFVSSSIYSNRQMLNTFLAIWFFVSIMYIVKDSRLFILGSNKWSHGFDMFVGFSGYFGYLLLAYRLQSYSRQNTMFAWKCFLGALCTLFIIWLLQMKFNRLPIGGYGYLLPTTIVLSAFVFLFFSNIPFSSSGKIYSSVKKFSELSFGIYLSHMMFFKIIVQPLVYDSSTSWLCQIGAIIITLMISFIFTWMVSLTSFKRYIIG